MAFHPDSGDAKWTQRVRNAEAFLAPSGVPRWIVDDRSIWSRFVQSGYAVDMERSWFFRVDMLTDGQLVSLVALLRALGENDYDIWTCLIGHPRGREVLLRTGNSHVV